VRFDFFFILHIIYTDGNLQKSHSSEFIKLRHVLTESIFNFQNKMMKYGLINMPFVPIVPLVFQKEEEEHTPVLMVLYVSLVHHLLVRFLIIILPCLPLLLCFAQVQVRGSRIFFRFHHSSSVIIDDRSCVLMNVRKFPFTKLVFGLLINFRSYLVVV